MGGTLFGIGSPVGYPTSQLTPFGISAYGTQAFGSNPSTLQQPFGQPLQQILQVLQQVLQIVPQQLQHLQQLEYAQQQQLQQLHQILQVIPAQLAQLHQLVQFAPQQIQQMQQQPFGQLPGPGGVPTNPQWWPALRPRAPTRVT